ncbi:MAG: alpha/beta hydrolase [Desulfobacteraceae bacterium]
MKFGKNKPMIFYALGITLLCFSHSGFRQTFAQKPLEWSSCYEDRSVNQGVIFECADLKVPLDHQVALEKEDNYDKDTILIKKELLPNSRLVSIKGWGHGSPSSCADSVMIQYLLDGQLPEEGKGCRQDEDIPFGLTQEVAIRDMEQPLW